MFQNASVVPSLDPMLAKTSAQGPSGASKSQGTRTRYPSRGSRHGIGPRGRPGGDVGAGRVGTALVYLAVAVVVDRRVAPLRNGPDGSLAGAERAVRLARPHTFRARADAGDCRRTVVTRLGFAGHAGHAGRATGPLTTGASLTRRRAAAGRRMYLARVRPLVEWNRSLNSCPRVRRQSRQRAPTGPSEGFASTPWRVAQLKHARGWRGRVCERPRTCPDYVLAVGPTDRHAPGPRGPDGRSERLEDVDEGVIRCRFRRRSRCRGRARKACPYDARVAHARPVVQRLPNRRPMEVIDSGDSRGFARGNAACSNAPVDTKRCVLVAMVSTLALGATLGCSDSASSDGTSFRDDVGSGAAGPTGSRRRRRVRPFRCDERRHVRHVGLEAGSSVSSASGATSGSTGSGGSSGTSTGSGGLTTSGSGVGGSTSSGSTTSTAASSGSSSSSSSGRAGDRRGGLFEAPNPWNTPVNARRRAPRATRSSAGSTRTAAGAPACMQDRLFDRAPHGRRLDPEEQLRPDERFLSRRIATRWRSRPRGRRLEAENGYECTQDGDCHLIVVQKARRSSTRCGAPTSRAAPSTAAARGLGSD